MNFPGIIWRALVTLWEAFLAKTRSEGARAEREEINRQSAEQLQRQNEVANKPVSDEELQKSLKDGTF